MAAPLCSYPPCIRRTADPTGRCHDHRWDGSAKPRVSAVPPAPPAPRPVSEEFEGEDPSIFSRSVVRSEDGTETEVHEWKKGDRLNRWTGPAHVSHFGDGARKEEWYLAGNLSRLDGPAVEIYDAAGEVVHREFYLLGNRMEEVRQIGNYIGETKPEMRDFFLATSAYRVLMEEGVPTERLAEIIGGGVNSVSGVRRVLDGTPIEWVAAYEEGGEG